MKSTGTVLDRLVLVNTESVWLVHERNATDANEHRNNAAERKVTVLLIQYASPLAAASLPRKINTETDMIHLQSRSSVSSRGRALLHDGYECRVTRRTRM